MSKEKSPSVFIVTINWNGLEDTVECLESLHDLDYPNYKIVVVDNGSKNKEADKILKQFPDVTLIKNKTNLGFTGGCNKGIERALKDGADYVLLLNNDTIVTKNFLNKLVKFYDSTADAGVVSSLVLFNDKKTVWYSGVSVKTWTGIVKMDNKGKLIKDTILPKKPYKTDYAIGACLLVSTNLIRKMGMLDDIYFAYYEDTEWGYRARRYGYESYVVPNSVIYHKKSASTGSGGSKRFSDVPAYYLARNGIIFSRSINSWRKIPYFLAQYFIKAPLSLIFLVSLRSWPSYLRGLLSGTKIMLNS